MNSKNVVMIISTFLLVTLLCSLSLLSVSADPPPPPEIEPPSPPELSETGIVLLAPEDDAYVKDTSVTFTFLVEIDSIDECTIDIDDGDASIELPTVITDREYDRSKRLSNGNHDWFVVCTDTAGEEYESETSKFTIDTRDPTLTLPSSVLQGDVVLVKGEHYWAEELELEMLDDDDNLLDLWYVDVENDGSFTESITLRYDLEPGSYSFETSQLGHTEASKTKSFTIQARNPALTTDKDVYFTGQTVKIMGEEFGPYSRVAITVSKPDGSSIEMNQIAKVDGSFTANYVLNGQREKGTYSLNAEDTRYDTLSASSTFELEVETKTNDDYDKDGIINLQDNCPYKANPSQTDADSDGTGDACDSTPNGYVSPEPIVTDVDFDNDGVLDDNDNCPAAANPSQSDVDADGIGDACDPRDDSPNKNSPNMIDEPIVQEPKATFPFLLVIIIVVVLIVGGTIGYLAFEGKLNFSNMGGSATSLLHPEANSGASGVINAQQSEELKAFIFGQRSKGFDDLTIRNALVEKGWNESDVDGVFEQVYDD